MHGLVNQGRLTIVASLKIQSREFKLWDTASITINLGGTLQFVPPYSKPVSTENIYYGAQDIDAVPYPLITNYGTLAFDAPIRDDFPLDSCEIFARLVSNGTITASSPACTMTQPYVNALADPAPTSALDGPFSFTGTGHIEFLGGSWALGPRLSQGSAGPSAQNFVKFGDKEGPTILGSASNGKGWVYLKATTQISVTATFWLDGTAFLAGPKITFTKFLFSAGALTSPVDISGNWTVLENTGSYRFCFLFLTRC